MGGKKGTERPAPSEASYKKGERVRKITRSLDADVDALKGWVWCISGSYQYQQPVQFCLHRCRNNTCCNLIEFMDAHGRAWRHKKGWWVVW